ncbi:uncharacterized mitochondrial protein AtMg00300-like [Salvia miltiorrhiza]|uniref:uncharacterized mitochondrial protein AtMg00300-like n=1 Tax=Salvia miltiorrhiza TaxID=226208 RepID=UPI0025AC6B48|nr:uncharacterized mitochondrial protein AtMg00300-like [Salvia miltiorrhiza]
MTTLVLKILWLVMDNQTNKILMKGRLSKGLYQLDLSSLYKSSHYHSSCKSSCNPSALTTVVSRNKSDINHVQTSVLSNSSKSFAGICKTSMNTLHQSLGHPGTYALAKVCKSLKTHFHISELNFCEACKLGKLHQKSHITQAVTSKAPFDLVYSDLWGPAHTPSTNGYKYYIAFVDDYSRYTWIFPLTLKSEAALVVHQFLAHIMCLFKLPVKALQTDWGGGENFAY